MAPKTQCRGAEDTAPKPKWKSPANINSCPSRCRSRKSPFERVWEGRACAEERQHKRKKPEQSCQGRRGIRRVSRRASGTSNRFFLNAVNDVCKIYQTRSLRSRSVWFEWASFGSRPSHYLDGTENTSVADELVPMLPWPMGLSSIRRLSPNCSGRHRRRWLERCSQIEVASASAIESMAFQVRGGIPRVSVELSPTREKLAARTQRNGYWIQSHTCCARRLATFAHVQRWKIWVAQQRLFFFGVWIV